MPNQEINMRAKPPMSALFVISGAIQPMQRVKNVPMHIIIDASMNDIEIEDSQIAQI